MIFRILTIILVVLWLVYWEMTSYFAEKYKPKTKIILPWWLKTIVFTFCVGMFFILQLTQKIKTLTFHNSLPVEAIGFLFVVFAFFILIKARMDLGYNWTNGWEYQIKKKHELITTGIYAYIRHPIYLGIILLSIGTEMVSGSFLCLLLIGLFIPGYLQGKREEKILTAHFKDKYSAYMKKTSMFIPWVL